MVESAWGPPREEQSRRLPPAPFGPMTMTVVPAVDEAALDELCGRIRGRIEQAVREGVVAAIESLERVGAAAGDVVDGSP